MLIRKCKYLYRTVHLDAFFESKCCNHTSRKHEKVFMLTVISWPETPISVYNYIFSKRGNIGRFVTLNGM